MQFRICFLFDNSCLSVSIPDDVNHIFVNKKNKWRKADEQFDNFRDRGDNSHKKTMLQNPVLAMMNHNEHNKYS